MFGKTGEKNPLFGKSHSTETIAKMSEIQKNIDRTGENNPMFGKTGEKSPNFGKCPTASGPRPDAVLNINI